MNDLLETFIKWKCPSRFNGNPSRLKWNGRLSEEDVCLLADDLLVNLILRELITVVLIVPLLDSDGLSPSSLLLELLQLLKSNSLSLFPC